MATPVWQPGTLYPTGSIVQPTSPVTPPFPTIDNPNFTGNADDWTLTGASLTTEATGIRQLGH